MLGCIGLPLMAGASGLIVVFVVRAMMETQSCGSRWRGFGLGGVLLGLGFVAASSWISTDLFDYSIKKKAEARVGLSEWRGADTDTVLAVFDEEHPRSHLRALWIGGAVSFAGGLLALGDRSKGWLLAAFLAALAAGPLVLHACILLHRDGNRSGN